MRKRQSVYAFFEVTQADPVLRMVLRVNLLIFLLVIICTTAKREVKGARIIGVLSTSSKSRYANMWNLAEELGLRNHEVWLIVSSAIPLASSPLIKQAVYKVPFDYDYIDNVVVPTAFNVSHSNPVKATRMWTELFVKECSSLIKMVIEELTHWREFDLIFTDTPPECGAIISDLLELPRVDICPAFALRVTRGIGPVSYIPHAISVHSNEMTFIERVQNILITLCSRITFEIIGFPSSDELKKSFNITPERPFKESRTMAELVIVMGHFALEYAQPVLPDYKLVGPLTVKPPKELSPNLETFVSGAGEKGVVIFSLGTLGDAILQLHHVQIFARVFGRLEQRVVWRLRKHSPQHLPPNIKVLNWIPQNDLLAHKSTKVFISHTGHNSLYESAFYGVPLVCIPLFADQFGNCVQAQSVGIAVGININTMSEEEVYQKIQLVLKTSSFQGNATRISNLMRDSSRTPVQEAADWVEYVDRHKGAKHLRAHVYNLYWYQEYLLDVGAFLLLVTVAMLLLMKTLLRCLCKIVCKTRDKGVKKMKRQ